MRCLLVHCSLWQVSAVVHAGGLACIIGNDQSDDDGILLELVGGSELEILLGLVHSSRYGAPGGDETDQGCQVGFLVGFLEDAGADGMV